jgi:FAD/FMN-containing dehydrogenase
MTAPLREALSGPVFEPGDPGYDAGRLVWNGGIDRRPDVVARCADAADVQAAVRVAREHGMPFTVRGGGHDWAGRGTRDGGLLLDLTGMRGVTVDPATGIATAGGGAQATDVAAAGAPYGLAPASGVVGSVGMVGLTTGGGYGPLIGVGGLGLDRLAGADVVLADGTAVRTEDDEDLFWALRGGGGNFGVVTAARYRLLPVPVVVGGMVFFAPPAAGSVFAGLRELAAEQPDELTVMSGFLPGEDGGMLPYVAPVWSGDPADADPWMKRLATLGPAVFEQLGPMPYGVLLTLFDRGAQPGNVWALGGRHVPELTPEVADVLVAAAGGAPAPSLIAVHQFHGAATRVPVESTAFGRRDGHLLVEILGGRDLAASGDAYAAWSAATLDALAPHALPGGYVNLTGPAETDRVAAAYGPNLGRLLELKRRYDPDRVLSAVPTLPA